MKRVLLLFSLLITHFCGAQSPTNNCDAGVTALTVGSSCSSITWDVSSNIGSPGLTTCGSPSGRDGWGWFTATSALTTVEYTNTNRNAVIFIYSGSCGSLTYMTCVNNLTGTGTEIVSFATTIGNPYFVRIASTSGSSMDGSICVYNCTAPANDNPCSATGLTVATSCSFTSYNVPSCATASTVANPSCNGIAVKDIWFTATVPASGQIVFNTNTGGITDLDMALYSVTGGCSGTFTQLYCDDDLGTGDMPMIVASGLTAGSTVYLRVWARNNSQAGSFQLCAYDPCPSGPPSNDNPCGASSLAVNNSCTSSTHSITTCATPSSVANPTCNNTSVNDIWFSLTVPSSGQITLSTIAGGINDLDMALYSVTGGCSGTFTQLYCDDDDGPGSMPLITASGLTSGSTVYLRVWARNNAQTGNFQLCAVNPCPAPPSNDNPCGATSLTVNATCILSAQSITTCATSGSVANPSCNNIAVRDIWFSATVPVSGRIAFSTTAGTLTDADMALYTAAACAGPFTEVSCDDLTGPGNMPEIVATGLTAGSTVYLRVWAKNNAQTGTFNLCAYEPCSPPAFDEPCGATVLTVNTSCSYTSYSTLCASSSAGIPAPGCASYSGGDVWFAVTVPVSGGLNIDTKEGTLTDMGMALYSATNCSSGFTLIACDDDNSTNGFMPYISVTSLVPGSVVFIRCWDKNNDLSGTFDICVSDPCPNGIPTNDLPCDAQDLTIGITFFGDNGCATSTNDPATPSCWTSGNSNTVWYKITAPASGTLKMRTYLNSLTNSQIALFSGTCSSLTLVACNDNATQCPGASTVYYSELTATGLTAGQVYYIAVDGTANYMGTFNIVVTDGTAFNPIPQQDCIYPTLICNQITTVGNPGFVGAGNVCDYTTPYACYGGGERNSVWYYFNIQTAGTLLYNITPNVSSTDYDFMLFNATGSSFTTICSAISAQSVTPVRCNFSGTSGTTGLATGATSTSVGSSGSNKCSPLTVSAGDKYLLLITNYSNNNTGFTLDFLSTSPLSYSSTPTSVVWTGGIDNDWFKAGNWGGCAIPSCNIDAYIVNGPLNQPVINGSGAVAKSVNIDPGAHLTLQGNNTLQVCGDYNNSGELDANSASTILFGTGSAVQNINGSLTGLNQFPNLRIQKLGGQVNLNQNIDITGNLTVQSLTSVFNINGKYVKLGGNFSNANGASTFINPEGSTLEFAGLNAQTVTNGGGSLTLGSVRIDNKSTGVTLSGSTSSLNIGPTGILDLNDGVFITAVNNEVNVTNPSPSSVNSGNPNSYVRGRLRRTVGTTTGNYYFPVGNASSGYELAEINYTTAPTSSYSLLATFSNWVLVPNGPLTSDCSGKNYSLKPALNHGYWTINASVSPASGTYNVTLNNVGYSNSTGTFWSVMKRSPSGSLGTWTVSGTCDVTSTADVSKRTGLSGFSDFASIQWASPLPIELSAFSAEKSGQEAICKWSTASEENNDFFTIERSSDKISFEVVGKVKGAGNSSVVNNYRFTDKYPLAGLSYYRVRQTDFNGQSTTSEWRSVDFSAAPSQLILYPNPASRFINCSFMSDHKGMVEISVIDVTQKELIRYRTEMLAGQNRIPVNIENIPDGVYFIKLRNADTAKGFFEMTSKFIKGKSIK